MHKHMLAGAAVLASATAMMNVGCGGDNPYNPRAGVVAATPFNTFVSGATLTGGQTSFQQTSLPASTVGTGAPVLGASAVSVSSGGIANLSLTTPTPVNEILLGGTNLTTGQSLGGHYVIQTPAGSTALNNSALVQFGNNLSPGNYQFSVETVNSLGQISPPQSLNVNVLGTGQPVTTNLFSTIGTTNVTTGQTFGSVVGVTGALPTGTGIAPTLSATSGNATIGGAPFTVGLTSPTPFSDVLVSQAGQPGYVDVVYGPNNTATTANLNLGLGTNVAQGSNVFQVQTVNGGVVSSPVTYTVTAAPAVR